MCISSWNTSGVTTMKYMFFVRTLAPTSYQPRALPCSAACAVAPPHRPLTSRPAPPPASYTHLATRQKAEAFNQPLTFDTSKVATMRRMFKVRTLATTSIREPFPACPLAPTSIRAAPYQHLFLSLSP